MTTKTVLRCAMLSMLLAGCGRAAEQSADSARVIAAGDTAPRTPRAPEIPQYREFWVPHWELALQHTESVTVSVSQPTSSCRASGRTEVARDMGRADGYRNMVLAVTNEPFDTIARLAGFERRGNKWVTVGYDGHARDAFDVTGASSRTLRGAGLGTRVPTIPTKEKGMTLADSNALRHHALVATFEHPKGCTAVLRYFPNYEGGDDTADVRRIVESVRLGPDAITKPFPDSVADAQGVPEEDTVGYDHSVGYGDSGIGLVIFDDSAAVETVTVYTARDRQSPVILRIARDMETRLTVVGDTTIDLTAFEYAYEVGGLVVDQLAPDSTSARIEYTSDTLGNNPKYGWVDLSVGHVKYTSWRTLLLEAGTVSFLKSVREPFRASPDGPAVSKPLVGRYPRMTPVETQGDWMLVRAQTPNDECEAEAPRVRESLVWIRFLDARGRKLVFYPSRGC